MGITIPCFYPLDNLSALCILCVSATHYTEGIHTMPEFPRLRWLLLLQLVAIGAASLDTGSIIDALSSAGILAPGIVSLVLFVFRVGGAFVEIDTEDGFVHTMTSGRKIKQPGLWELVW